MKVLSEASIKTLAGDAAYQRGLDYYNNGAVSNLEIDDTIVKAHVHGTNIYQVQLRHTAKIFEGSCDCPASDNFDFCKHCVAVALSYYYNTQSNQELEDSPQTDTLLHYLGTLTKPRLSEELYAVIQQDKHLHELWKLRAELATGRLNTKDLRKQITKAISFKPSGIWRFNEVASYFGNAEQRIRALCPAIDRLPPTEAIKLLTYAYERLEKTLETIDDSSGYRISLLELLEKQLKAKVISTEFDEAARIKFISSLFVNEKYNYELIRNNAELFDSLSKQEHKTLVKTLADYWSKLPPPNKDDFYKDTPFFRIERVLIDDAQNRGEASREIEILTKGAVTVSRCLELVDRCLDFRDFGEANKWLRYASQLENLRLSDISAIEHGQVKIWLSEGNYKAALEAQWAVFVEDESLTSILALMSSAESIGERKEWAEKCVVYLKAQLSDDISKPKHIERCETLIALLLQEGRQPEAVALAHKVKLKVGTLMALVNQADRLGKMEINLASRACNYLIAFGNHDTNQRAINFLTKIRKQFGDTDQGFVELINDVYHRPENKRKINFTKELKQDFGGLIESR